MATLRFKALEDVVHRKPVQFNYVETKTSDYFGINVFNRNKMQQYLSAEAFEMVEQASIKGTRVDRKLANQVALGMKAWAIEKGATHYTHWFHPLNGSTAEKHDAFFEPTEDGGAIENFSGTLLVQQEPDASSFPSGGIRNTFEARGYTAWDPSSPAFILDNTLCIPTIFVSYTGEALDFKTPLLKSNVALDIAAQSVCQFFSKDITKVIATLGWEQEYFLIDEALFNARPDLMLTGRTLMGHSASKDQQLEDHYFGAIPERVTAYMKDFEKEALKLGIPVKTRHNEVAPNQFECAPVFEEANLAVDHNMLLMSIMNKTARKHNFKVLFHEKPFAGINGSGKHNNWSMQTNTGVNLLSPGKNPKSNLRFLTFVINTLKAVHEHSDLLRASILTYGNTHRLGANEAPPAIVSVFLGSHINKMIDKIEKSVSDKSMTPDEKAALKLDIGKIPEILLDNTDRNRTSPFAFTGNRFEFRAVGSSANCASPMITLNTIMANQLNEFYKEVNEIIDSGVKKDEAIFRVLRKYIKSSRKVVFEGNGYSKEWIEEAAKRGLSNVTSVPESLKAFISKKSIDLMERNHVLSKRELDARYEIRLNVFQKKIQIESRVIGDLAINHIIPTAIKYQNVLVENVRGMRDLLNTGEFNRQAGLQLETLKEISGHISSIKEKVDAMVLARKNVNVIEDIIDLATAYNNEVLPYIESIRYHIDRLELIVDDEIWPLPKYRELLFVS
ncbi:MAG: glutamine synthetase type III [Bacteroidetes bacterium CG2_30_33_31]|nr:MAG: glutamine synthetase type III [Bacteroidetes bacterium CG2_30_33_31]